MDKDTATCLAIEIWQWLNNVKRQNFKHSSDLKPNIFLKSIFLAKALSIFAPLLKQSLATFNTYHLPLNSWDARLNSAKKENLSVGPAWPKPSPVLDEK